MMPADLVPTTGSALMHVAVSCCFLNCALDLLLQGGDKHSIEEDTLTSLFDTGYETHPMISVPIQMVEINNVPPELKRCLGVSSSRTAVKSPLKVRH